MKFNKSPESQQENYFSEKEKEEQLSKLQDYGEDLNEKLFKEKIKEQRKKEKNIPGSNIEIGFKREKLCFEALQELKREGKIIDILPTGMVDAKGKFNENPIDLDLYEQTDFLITVASKGRIRFVKISVKPFERKNTDEKKADILLNISLDDNLEEIKEQIEQKLANI